MRVRRWHIPDAEDSYGLAPKPARSKPWCGEYTVPLTGDLSTCAFPDGGNFGDEFCHGICGGYASCSRFAGSAKCNAPCAVDGRRYATLDDRDAPCGDSVGDYLARMAFFEAASVDAFALLERDLRMHGAPARLTRSCRQARQDEVRHTRMAAKLARRHGGVVAAPPAPPTVAIASLRGLEAIAIENAVEGCVRETFGVVLGMWQSHAAPSAELRAFFSAITRDEMRHAALSARIDEWLRSRLSGEACRRVDAARADAAARLEASLLEGEPPNGLGLPTAAQSRALYATWQEASSALAA